MAYLPFYITPEEFAAEQAKQKQAIESGQQLKQWTRHNIEEPDRFYRLKIWLMPTLIATVFFSFLGSLLPTYFFISMCAFGWLFITYLGYLTLGVDERYEYTLSEHGLYYTKRRAEPTWLPKVLHIGAWFGVVGCVIAVVFIGPMALTGAGGCLLLSFVMVKNKYEPEIEEIWSPHHQWLCARYHLKRKVICLYSQQDYCENDDEPNEGYVWRVQTRGCHYLFFKDEVELLAARQLVELQGIQCDEEQNKKVLFDLDSRPRFIIDYPITRASFPRDEIELLRDTPLPKSTTGKALMKEVGLT